MNYIVILGLLAGFCTTIAVIPQIRKSWKQKKVDNVSPLMFIILITGLSLWVLYGIIQNDFPVILTNGVSLVLNSFMMYLMIKYGKK
ncbi:SemiSWEET family sugar transporter [Sinomicrobium soli]|uniref:SemiSWEET family sugar transporter n=1 Tax=Sinomicrobium sp. N-1-3-6 TaxID=2219864 RepID=UPI000DCAE32B|nr:SemiSWEET transporter [Sinomicrobium sp. N-1-3-6]RAV28629.1 hypothetical protein DN748_11770 [Sinomicrobium sp. N-1-3-6]